MPNFQFVIAKITLAKPCSSAILARYNSGEEVELTGTVTCAVISGLSEYKIRAKLTAVNVVTCVPAKEASATGEVSAISPLTLTPSVFGVLPNGMYELRFEVTGAKKTESGEGPAEQLALETCLFKVGDVPEVGIYLGWHSMTPCFPGFYGKKFLYEDKFLVRVMDDDPAGYQVWTRFQWWNAGGGGLFRDFAGAWNYGFSAGHLYPPESTAGGVAEIFGEAVIVHTYQGFAYPQMPGGYSPSPTSFDLCDIYRQKFFKVCVADVGFPDPFGSSSSSSSSSSTQA